ncbi:MAG: pilin [Alteromonadaceae bacterium]|nr:pilin [Alteromonadaceae bacterium]
MKLIEMRIVVEIIGILAAIAVPQYQDYIARSQAAEALTLLGGAKTPVEEFILTKGTFPDDSKAGEDLKDDLGINTSGQYVGSIAAGDQDVSDNGEVTGTLTATFKTEDISAALNGKSIYLERTVEGGNAKWTCWSGDLEDKYLPSGCSNT